MVNLIGKAFLKFSKIHEVHALPGRLRVKLPGLEKAKDLIHPSEISEIFEAYRLKGVESLEVNFVSSKALIIYDESQTDKDHILKFMNRLREKLFELYMEDKNMSEELISKLFRELKEEGYEFEG